MRPRIIFEKKIVPVIFLLGIPAVLAQVSRQTQSSSPADQLSFEVVSVKLHKDATSSHDPFVKGRRVSSVASTLIDLVTYAYGMRYDALSGGPA